MTNEHTTEIATRAKNIDPDKFVAFRCPGSILDPYLFADEGEDDVYGWVWWINDPTTRYEVTAGDFLEAHPDLDWATIEAREVAASNVVFAEPWGLGEL